MNGSYRHAAIAVLVTASLGISAAAAAPAQSPSFSTIYGFAAGGANPVSAPILGQGGVLYGTTANGGADFYGAVYSLVPPTGGASLGAGAIIYSFAGGTDGQSPLGGLVADSAGNFYGTTYGGGANGFGTIFELAPPTGGAGNWTKTTLFSFTGGADGAYPRSGLTKCGTGLCGTTSGIYGVAGSFGTVFQLARPTKKIPSWHLTTLYAFLGGNDGSAPDAPLLRGSSGTLFGTATGNLGGTGNVFSLTPPSGAGGTWTHTVLHDFPFGSDGYTPIGGLVSDSAGVLYGTTNGGGANDGGTVYRLTPPAAGQTVWTEDLLTSLPAGTAPEGTPSFGPGGQLYFTTTAGGTANFGTVAALQRSKTGAAPWSLSIVHNFAGGADGEVPAGGLLKAPGNILYGTSTGGDDTVGTVFTVTK